MADIIRVEDLLDSPPPSVPCWIEPDILPKGSILIFGGPAKIGKSFIALELARALITGDNPFYHQKFVVPKKAKVLLWEQELGEKSLYKRLADTLQNHKRSEWEGNFLAISKAPEMSLSEKGGVQMLSQILEENKTEVLIIDPIGKVQNYDENDATSIGELFNRLQLIIKAGIDRGLSIIISHHFKKLPSGVYAKDYDLSSPDNFRGSNRWLSDPDTVITALRTNDFTYTPPGSTKIEKGWFVKTHWVLRHGQEPEDMILRVCPKAEKIVTVAKRGILPI